MRTPRLSAGCLAVVMVTAGFSSGAGAQANCDTYGKLALQQQQENVDAKCGFSGTPWSPDLKAHVAWCASVSPEQWKVQLQSRKQQLDACKSK